MFVYDSHDLEREICDEIKKVLGIKQKLGCAKRIINNDDVATRKRRFHNNITKAKNSKTKRIQS
jgi:hypothetical protein